MYLVFPKVLETREIGSNLVGVQRQGVRPEILLSPKEVLTLMDQENGRDYVRRLMHSGTKEQTLFGGYQPHNRGIYLFRILKNLKEWAY